MSIKLECGKIYDLSGQDFGGKDFVIVRDNVVIKNLSCSEIVVEADNVVLDGCVANAIFVRGCSNALVAKSRADEIVIEGCFNCSVILNETRAMSCSDSVSLYVIDNSVSENLSINNNDYVIADGNAFSCLSAKDNTNTNGGTLTDVDARVKHGANEAILPHTNKELFVGMPRRCDVANSGLSVRDYINECAKTQDSVIIPPGAYKTSICGVLLNKAFSGKTLYAYGAYVELDTEFKNYPGAMLKVGDAEDVNVYGITIGYALPSSGQVRVVDKHLDGDRCLLTLINDAGYGDGFTYTDTDKYHTFWPETFLYDEQTGEYSYRVAENPNGSHRITRNLDENGNYDGTMTMEILDRGTAHYTECKPARDVWDRITKNTVMTCRLTTPCRASFFVENSKNVLLRDCVLYGYTAAMSVLAHGTCENVHFLRYNDTNHSASVIDKETYDKYRAYEQKYGVDFELYQDEHGLYRGATSRSSSVDAFHINTCLEGVRITSSLLESMVDDGCNQHAASSRLHGYRDNGDGTTTLIYKPLVAHANWASGKSREGEDNLPSSSCMDFKAGHKIYVYNPYGRAVCETEVLSDAVEGDSVDIDLTYEGLHKHIVRPTHEVTVRTADVDFEALTDYKTGLPFDLSDNRRELDNRICVDNLSFNCTGYTIDNVMVRNGHTRGFLIKVSDATIKHCTFRNVSYSGLLLRPEWGWGESSVARRIMIEKCLFDRTGSIYQGFADKNQACIRIQSTSDKVSEDTLPIDKITVKGCKFTNNEQRYAIWVNSAKNVTIKNNVFDPVITDILPEVKGTAVLLETCMNVEISGNEYNYAHFDGDVKNVIGGENYANITGTDVTDANGNPIFPDNVK